MIRERQLAAPRSGGCAMQWAVTGRRASPAIWTGPAKMLTVIGPEQPEAHLAP